MIPRPPRRHPRRAPGLHRAPALPAPETPAEVLERGGMDVAAPPAPPLRKDQIAKLEALTAIWERQTRLEGPADATLVYSAPKPPPPPAQRRAEPPPATEAPEPSPVPAPVPGPDAGTVPARVSDWASRHDVRSLEFAVREKLGARVPLQDVSLAAGPVLDQGTAPPLSVIDASACVGMASAVAANVIAAGPPLDEDDARRLYAWARTLDHIHGENYAGTSVLAGMKAGLGEGLWEFYLWALGGTKDIAQVLLQLRRAVVVGVPWSAGCETPDAAGVIVPGGADLGGHALAVVGLRLVHAGRPGPWFELQQSRGTSEGLAGRVFIHHKDLSRLLAGIGEAAVPLLAGDVQ